MKHIVTAREYAHISIASLAPNELWHVDVTGVNVRPGYKLYIQVVMDNFSRYALAWKVTESIRASETVETLQAAKKCASELLDQPSTSTVMMDPGSENNNRRVSNYISSSNLIRTLARVEIRYSNSMIESLFRQLKNNYLYHQGIRTIQDLERKVSFTTRDAARLGVHAASLAHYAKRGDIERIARGIYRSSSAPTIEDIRWEDLYTAIRSVKSGVICLTSALAIYGLTEEMPRQHWIAVDHSTRHRAGSSVKVVRMRNLTLGQTTIELGKVQLPIFDRERTIVDAFRALSQETAIKALKSALTTKKREERIDMKKLGQYAKKLRVSIEPYVLAVTT